MSTASSIALRFAWRELRHGARALRGFGVFLGCLALGVAAIAGVQSTASSIVTGLRADGRAILGGDLALRSIYQDLAPAERRLLENVSEAITHFAEMRTMARRPGAEASVLVELKAVDDRYPLFGRLETRGGEGADAPLVAALERRGDAWGALVDPALADRLAVAEGDALSVGGIDFEVRGIIAREPDRAGSGAPFGFWPRVLVSLDGLAATQLLREGSLVYHQYAARLAPEVRLEDVRAELGETFRDSGWQMRTYDNAAPGIQRMIGRLGSFLSLVGLTALLVGGVGVGNAVRAWLDTRLGVIATLKCIGASRAVVFRTYLVQLTVIAGLGVLAGLAIGAFAPVVVSAMLETLLPFPIALGIYPGVLAVAVAFGLLTAVTFTVWPLSRAHETPAVALFRGVGLGVRPGRRGHLALALAGGAGLAALAVATAPNRSFAVWFIAGGALLLIVFRIAGWAVVRAARAVHESNRPREPAGDRSDRSHEARQSGPGFRRLRLGPRMRMAVANLYRPGNATADIVLSLGLGLTVLVAVALVEANLRREIADSLPEDAPAFFFVGVESDRIDRLTGTVESIQGTERFRSVPFLRGRIVRVNGLDPEEALVNDEHGWLIRGDRGLSYAAVAPDNPVVDGEWWPEDYAGPPLLSVDVDVIDAFELALGDTITLNVLGREITAEVRHVRRVEWQGMQVNFALLLSPEPLRRAPPQLRRHGGRDAGGRGARRAGAGARVPAGHHGAGARGVGSRGRADGQHRRRGARRRRGDAPLRRPGAGRGGGGRAPAAHVRERGAQGARGDTARRGPRPRGGVRAAGAGDRGHRGRRGDADGVGGDHPGAGAGLDVPARHRRRHRGVLRRADPEPGARRHLAGARGVRGAASAERVAVRRR